MVLTATWTAIAQSSVFSLNVNFDQQSNNTQNNTKEFSCLQTILYTQQYCKLRTNMKSFHLICILAQFIQPILGAGSYDVVQFEQLTSPHREFHVFLKYHFSISIHMFIFSIFFCISSYLINQYIVIYIFV
jgi:hypothetical protein